MEKLGFVLRRAYKGDDKIGSVNESETWSRYASDVRSSIEQLKGFETPDKEVTLLRFLGEKGYFATFIRSIQGGRGGDNISAWVHFPVNLEIPMGKMQSLIEKIEKEMESQSHSSEFDEVNWREIFNEEYDTKKAQNPIVGSIISKGVAEGTSISEKEVAGRCYDKGTGYSLCELLVDYIAQPEYKNYSGIFLIDSQSGVALREGRNEITTNPRKTVTFTLPDDKDGFKALHVDIPGRTIEVLEGDKFSIKWSKRGYKDIVKEITADTNSDKMYADTGIEPSEKRIIVHREWFKVLDADGKDISPNSKITINGNEFKDNVLYMTEVPTYKVGVSCAGYETESKKDIFEAFLDKLPNGMSTKTVRTQLKVKLYNQRFKLPYDQGNNLKYDMNVLVTSQEQTKVSPFKGYSVMKGEDKKLELHYVVGKKSPGGHASMWKNPMFYVVCVIVALVFMAFGFGVRILIETNSSETEDLRIQINSLAIKNAELTDSVVGLSKQVSEKNAKIKELEDSSEKTNTEKDKEIGNLRDSISVLNESLGTLRKEKSDLVNENERLRNQRNEGLGENGTPWWERIFGSRKTSKNGSK